MRAAKSPLKRLVSNGGLPCMLLASLLRLSQPFHVLAQGHLIKLPIPVLPSTERPQFHQWNSF